MRLRNRKTIRPNAVLCTADCSSNTGGDTGLVFSLRSENAIENYAKVVQRMPERIDLDCSGQQDFRTEGLLKSGLSVKPDVRVR